MLAHYFTALRLLLALPTALAFARPQDFPAWAPLLFMVIAIASDLLDGKIARARGTASAVGQLFDHTTDCLFVTSALAGAASAGLLTMWLPVLVPLAFLQYVIDSRFLHRQKQLRMSSIGRWNGVFYFAPPLLLSVAALVMSDIASVVQRIAALVAWALALSTLVSIADRAFAVRLS